MLTIGEIKNVLIRRVKADAVLGAIPEIVKDVHAPVTEGSVGERIVIVVPGGADNGQFQRCYPRVCVYVPYRTNVRGDGTKYYAPDHARLTALGNVCIELFRSGTCVTDGAERCLYKMEDMTEEDDPETWSNFLNVRLRFEVINTKL
ncbi:MAG: hypothetical protein LBP50_03240 [Tannerella sp.]|jgi:hypothetical protein|nr:hypothetical protein [Tannerella sp.]